LYDSLQEGDGFELLVRGTKAVGFRSSGGSGVSLRQNPVSAVIPSPTDGWPVVRADQASPSMVQPTGIK